MKKEILILIGLPATGKSTFVNSFSAMARQDPSFDAKYPFVVLSTDNNVMELGQNAWGESNPQFTYNEAWKTFVDQADKKFYDDLRHYVAAGTHDIIIDRTNMSVKTRKRLFDIINTNPVFNVEAHVFGLEISAREWLRRLSTRPGKTIPINTLMSMANSYEKPTEAEGFRSIRFVN